MAQYQLDFMQPEPTLLSAPSPRAKNHGTSRNAGQRLAYGARSPESEASHSINADSEFGSTPARRRASGSHRQVCPLSKPVPDAMERLTRRSRKSSI